MTDKPRILFFNLAPWYRVQVYEDGSVRIFSDYFLYKNYEMSQWKDSNGYLMVKINNKNWYVHRLVAHLTLGEPVHGEVVNHIDANKLNNHPDNLEYCSIKDNIRHAIRMGLHNTCRWSTNPSYIDGRSFSREHLRKMERLRYHKDLALSRKKNRDKYYKNKEHINRIRKLKREEKRVEQA